MSHLPEKVKQCQHWWKQSYLRHLIVQFGHWSMDPAWRGKKIQCGQQQELPWHRYCPSFRPGVVFLGANVARVATAHECPSAPS
mmetsp:Transcript_18531/g.30979  ORF Transcript_18531/g.30979 Transcript_18531/m.30979 type:complete len:84 (-) Transcript_18531:71-322(-)